MRKIPVRVKEFIEKANLEIHSVNGKIMTVGLCWGDGKRMLLQGFPRKEQIQILDWLEKNTWVLEIEKDDRSE